MARTHDGFNKLRKNSNLVSTHEERGRGGRVHEVNGTCVSSLRNDIHKKSLWNKHKVC